MNLRGAAGVESLRAVRAERASTPGGDDGAAFSLPDVGASPRPVPAGSRRDDGAASAPTRRPQPAPARGETGDAAQPHPGDDATKAPEPAHATRPGEAPRTAATRAERPGPRDARPAPATREGAATGDAALATAPAPAVDAAAPEATAPADLATQVLALLQAPLQAGVQYAAATATPGPVGEAAVATTTGTVAGTPGPPPALLPAALPQAGLPRDPAATMPSLGLMTPLSPVPSMAGAQEAVTLPPTRGDSAMPGALPAAGAALAPTTGSSGTQAAPPAMPGVAPLPFDAASAAALATPASAGQGAATAPATTALPPVAAPAAPPMSDAGVAALAALVAAPVPGRGAAPGGDGYESATLELLSGPGEPTLLATAAPRGTTDTAAVRVQFAAPLALPTRPEAGMDDAFDQRVVWMVEQRIGQAEMRVSPDGAGPIDVRLQIDGQRVSAQFSAANADVRQALEAGMERLRDLLGQRGMELADTQVGQQRPQGDRPAPGRHAPPGPEAASGEEPAVTTVRALRARGLVDEYV